MANKYMAIKFTFDIDTPIYGLAIIINNVWKLIDHFEICINETWKAVDHVEMAIDGVWKDVPLV